VEENAVEDRGTAEKADEVAITEKKIARETRMFDLISGMKAGCPPVCICGVW
jgi:hypothetical protein